MTLPPGARLGPYEVVSVLGEGGMGVVYRAKDTRLRRDVALKVLREEVSSDAARLKRFETEARAASALNHPNVVTIYDFAAAPAQAWIAMECVEGMTLAHALSASPMPAARLLPIACQLADGLAAAHAQGIVHRDLKPENVMITRDGVVKILDFGIAKLTAGIPPDRGAGTPRETSTFPGAVLGTVGYMSPEQAQATPVDYRSDQFSFGSVLYEMATGRRAFRGKSSVDTLAAIINLEPEPIETVNPATPEPLRWIVERCLAKDPSRRYGSTQDLVLDLHRVRDRLSEATAPWTGRTDRRRVWLPVSLAAGVVAAGLLLAKGMRSHAEPPTPDFLRLTFRHGAVSSARFAPDGRAILYAATWNGEPTRLFATRTDGRDSTRLELPDANLAAISSAGEIALLMGQGHPASATEFEGTLARVPLTGGAPREVADNVRAADWSPDGRSLAVARHVAEKIRIEYPIGRVLYETSDEVESLRLSPAGDLVAFAVQGTGASVETVDLEGKHRVLSSGWKRIYHLAWPPKGNEVWFDANDRGWRTPIYAVTPAGKTRVVLRLPSWIGIQDISRDGLVLATLLTLRSTMRGLQAGASEERDLAWHEGSFAKSLTPDGRMLLFDEGGEGAFHAIYVRPMDGGPAKRLGEGRSLAISPDGRWAATNDAGRGSRLMLLPTGAGETRVLDNDGHAFEEATFSPDGTLLLAVAKDPGHETRTYVRTLPRGEFRLVGKDGLECEAFSPDGKQAACVDPEGRGVLCKIADGEMRDIPGFRQGEDDPLEWNSDGRSLFVRETPRNPPLGASRRLRISRIDLDTGHREIWREFEPPDALSSGLYYFTMTPDARAYAYSFLTGTSDLYLVSGLTSPGVR